MRRILVALDGSECAFRAVEYCGLQFAGVTDLAVTLLHVLPSLPPRFWDEGHMLSEEEREARRRLVEEWLARQKASVEPIFLRAEAMLEQKDIQEAQVETKIVYDSTDVAATILEEARARPYLTLVLGRCGFSPLRTPLLGSTTSRIINRGAGLAVCVVE
jgi:nucleotide-binding universal stress UspA family protein